MSNVCEGEPRAGKERKLPFLFFSAIDLIGEPSEARPGNRRNLVVVLVALAQ